MTPYYSEREQIADLVCLFAVNIIYKKVPSSFVVHLFAVNNTLDLVLLVPKCIFRNLYFQSIDFKVCSNHMFFICSDVDATMFACIAFSSPNLQTLDISMANSAVNRITGYAKNS
jgi:hypothetical protein